MLQVVFLLLLYVASGRGVVVTDDELRNISLELFDEDHHRATYPEVKIDRQMQILPPPANQGDQSPKPFFRNVDEAKVFRFPTYKLLIRLLNNYKAAIGVVEVVTNTHLAEQSFFLNQFLKSDIGKKLFNFLRNKAFSCCTTSGRFKETLKRIWFGLYSRSNGIILDSSGFEHVFVGETRANKTLGLHNWVQFYLQEKRGHINYYGYLKHVQPELYSVRLTWNGAMKWLGTTSIGTSPEYELAVFTLCFLTRPNTNANPHRCEVGLRDGRNEVTRNIKTYPKTSNGQQYVASAYFAI